MRIKNEKKSLLLMMIVALLLAGTAFSQNSGNLEEEINTVSFPLDQEIDVPFVPDGKFPEVGGKASVDLDERGTSTVRISVRNLRSIFDIEGLFASYVIWAVLPDGSTQRIGELRTDDPKKASGAQLKAVVNLNTFGMIVTIEP